MGAPPALPGWQWQFDISGSASGQKSEIVTKRSRALTGSWTQTAHTDHAAIDAGFVTARAEGAERPERDISFVSVPNCQPPLRYNELSARLYLGIRGTRWRIVADHNDWCSV
jgi:hypothetical protein